ncbi:FCD domain-containing protein [Telmatospirillum sp.]|uniref:GntR family transcriptional regulator n=1 Tax=Telmatospirillum sp. TaxID=2079197 RepID=UPI002845EFA7|nr:FCD domain-containing protein [Telmatospirillum sp.]MDR3439576.1 FCD domain-containing protein [Telmatospirillum sp.]
MSQSRPTAVASRTQTAYEQLRHDLIAGRLLPGDRLKINELSLSLGVSLGAVREALSRLTSEELVVAEPQRGFRVAGVSIADLRDLTMVRVEIEGMCLRRSIACGDVAWESLVVAAFHALSRTAESDGGNGGPGENWLQAHAAFHRALVSACGSAWLLRLQGLLYAQSERYRCLSLAGGGSGRDAQAEHQEIVEAVLTRSADRAAALLKAHFETTSRILESKVRSMA